MNSQYSKYYNHLKPVLKNKTVKTYSYIVFNLIAIIIFSLFAIRPTIKTIFVLHQTITAQKQILADLKEKSQNLNEGIKKYNNIPTDTKLKLVGLLPPSTSIPCLIESLSSIADSSQTSISGLQIQPVALKGESKCILTESDLDEYHKTASLTSPLQEIIFTVNIQGNYSQIINFLDLLRTSSRLLNVDLANFNKAEDGPLVISVTSKAYFYE